MGYKKEMSLNFFKLLITIIGSVVFTFLLLIYFNRYFLRLPRPVPIVIICIPIATMAISLILNRKFFTRKEIFTLKYSPWCPFIIYFNLKCHKSGITNDQIDEMREVLRAGDIVIRRASNYLDGLVLGQTSYFTHIGLYYGDWENKKHQVMHAVSHWGVSLVHLTEFCECESIAILRFNTDPEKMKKHLNRINNTSIDFINDKKNKLDDFEYIRLNNLKGKAKTSSSEFAETKDVRTFIEKKDDASAEVKALSLEELIVYDNLLGNTKHKSVNYIPQADTYIPLVLKQAKLLKGTPYDYNFNFIDFKTLSCVEFVWYCYKSLFPLHQIRRKSFLYFSWIKPFVIIPDMFVASDFFSLEYSSLKDAKEKGQLKRYTRSNLTKFRTFLLKFIGWNLIILMLIYFAFAILKKS